MNGQLGSVDNYAVQNGFKGIVQRELTGAETRLKRCALINYLVGNIYFFN
jgi:hypothetical protein